MNFTRRQLLVVFGSGVFAAALVVIVGLVMAGRGGQPDGSFELTKPGEFVEPAGTTAVPVMAGDDVLALSGLVDDRGRPADLELFRGGPLVINVWFSTCAPCSTELTDFAAVHDRYRDSVAFVGIDPFDSADTMARFADERGVDYDLWRDPDHEFVNAAGISSYPTTLFIDQTGAIVGRSGVLAAGELEAKIEELFGVTG